MIENILTIFKNKNIIRQIPRQSWVITKLFRKAFMTKKIKQFEESYNISSIEINSEIERQKGKINFDQKLELIFDGLKDNIEIIGNPYSIKNVRYTDSLDYESFVYEYKGIEIIGKKKNKTYNQNIFIGYYTDKNRYGLKLKKKNIPEIGIYFIIDTNDIIKVEEKLNKILSDKIFCSKIRSLKKYGFENNLNKAASSVKHFLFFKKKSIDEFDLINVNILYDFILKTLEIIYDAGLNDHKYFKELI